jgi:hypothetical protein
MVQESSSSAYAREQEAATNRLGVYEIFFAGFEVESAVSSTNARKDLDLPLHLAKVRAGYADGNYAMRSK